MKFMNKFKIFWLSQSLSQLGSSMTSFALIIWAYEKNGSVMDVSLMTFFSYMPYILASLLAGPLVDRHDKKVIMIGSDIVAALGSAVVLSLQLNGSLQMWHIYGVNCLIGFMNGFQNPAQTIAVGLMVPKENYALASGLNSFASNLITMAAPVFAAALLSYGGLEPVIIFDLCTFIAAESVLLLFISLPEADKTDKIKERIDFFTDLKEGVRFLCSNKGLFYVMAGMAMLNFFSRLTYENILTPMLLARSGGNKAVLGLINVILGAGGVLGGLLVTRKKINSNPVKVIYVSAAFSFLFGDILMGVGRDGIVWSVAALAASLPIPFVTAAQNICYYRYVPEHLQGRVFALRNVIQYGTIPLGLLTGGFLADWVFEPGMGSQEFLFGYFRRLVGEGPGSGMAVMFLCTGLLGTLTSLFWLKKTKSDLFL